MGVKITTHTMNLCASESTDLENAVLIKSEYYLLKDDVKVRGISRLK